MKKALPLVSAFLCACAGAATPQSDAFWKVEPLISATLIEPTGRYAHAVLGDAIEYGALRLVYKAGFETTIRLPQDRVFEDIEARPVDINGDGTFEVMVVESHADQGARLAIYTGNGLMAATPYIGKRFRWLAPIGAADLDGDGHVEVAYIDRPHLAKTLRVWRFENGTLQEVAHQTGLTNHRIGEDFITGGIRHCGDGPEMITVDAKWRHVMASKFDGTKLVSREIGPFKGKSSIAAALSCSQ